MSTFTFNIYLVQDIDGDGTDDYVLQDEGRIIISTQSITVDTDFRYIGGQIAAKPGSRPPLTFKIRKRPNDTWYMMVNQDTYCGMYSNREDCLGVLYGYYTHYNGLDNGFAVWLADSLEKGSILDPDANSPFTIERSGDDYTVVLGSPDANEIAATGTLGIMLQYSFDVDGTATFNSFGSLTDGDVAEVKAFGTETNVFTAGWLNQPDNTLARAAIVDQIGGAYLVLEVTDVIAKNENPATNLTTLSVDLSGQPDTDTDVEISDVVYPRVLGDAVLQPGDSLSYTFDWYREIPELTGITNDASPPAPSADVVITGLFDAPSSDFGSIDTAPSVDVGTATGLTSITGRGTGGGASRLFVAFDTTTNGLAFKSAIPDGSTATIEWNGETYTATAFTWTGTDTNLRINGDQWDSLPVNFDDTLSLTYTLSFYLA